MGCTASAQPATGPMSARVTQVTPAPGAGYAESKQAFSSGPGIQFPSSSVGAGAPSFLTRARGDINSPDFRIDFYKQEKGVNIRISPWHDIPLRNASDGSYNFVCEIPKWTRRKWEIDTKEPFNPIAQDTNKDGTLRQYKWGDMLFNYGAFPQTWEDPEEVSEHTGAIGDDDPIDVVELGTRSWPTGSVVAVKILGVIAMIDDGETDWKVLAINVWDPMAEALNDITDVRKQMPGAVEAITKWLRLYKTHKGVVNQFAFGGQAKNREFAEMIVEETHEFWKRMPKEEPNVDKHLPVDVDFTPLSQAY